QSVTTLSKAVTDLVHTETDAHIQSALLAVLSKPDEYVCHSSKPNGYDLGITHSTRIIFPENLRINGISSFKPKFYCHVNALFRSSEASEDEKYYYLGQYKGSYQFSKWLSLLDPHFFLKNDRGIYSVFTSGRFYPCSSKKQPDYNGLVKVDSRHATTFSVDKTNTTSLIWPHYYMAQHGESKADLILKWRDYVIFSDEVLYHATHHSSNNHFFIIDQKMQLKATPNSSPINSVGDFDIQPNFWSFKVDIQRQHWKQFVDEFFPKEIPFTLIPSLNLKKDIVKKIGDLYSLTLTTRHGRKDNEVLDGIPKYEIAAQGYIRTQFHPEIPFLEDNVEFLFTTSAGNVHDFEITFDKSENKCYGEGERNELDPVLKKLSNRVIFMEELPYGVHDEKPRPFEGGFPCNGGGFRLNSIKFEYQRGFPVRSLYHITVGWTHKMLLHEKKYYMKFHDFWNTIFN
uniref:Uncharacterized protein n=2 Tax=Clytia hemisphaerica TaxID=252671 RepID=A0A7M5V8E1_9CNID